jgi:uncharacterized protein (UPF0218 family)
MTLHALSYPWTGHVWDDKQNEELYAAMAAFDGGIQRIFIVKNPAAIDADEWRIIRRHLESKIEVRVIGEQDIGAIKPLLVTDDASFSWITTLGPHNSAETFTASANKSENQRLLDEWKVLWKKAQPPR